MLYELRHYTAPDTTALGALTSWFGEHAVPSWQGAGMRVVGCWTVDLGQQPRLTAILGFEDLNQRMSQFQRFYASDLWKTATTALNVNGKALISGIDTAILEPTPYSPDPFALPQATQRGIFEERVYRGLTSRTTARVNQRFAEHTVRLFQKHGIKPVAFWNVLIGADQPSIYYLVRYDDLSQRQPAWASFRSDPEWQQASAESERDGALLLRITSTILAPTRFSPMQ
jgi:NIPSNAP